MCAGNKRCEDSTEVVLNIEKGTHSGESILLEGLGDWNLQVQDYDDIVLQLEQKPHGRLTRRGNDLHLTQHISLCDALSGCEFNYRHLDNKDYTIKSSCVIDPECLYIVPKFGMPIKKNKGCGNLVISFKVDYPKQIITHSIQLETLLQQTKRKGNGFTLLQLHKA